LPSSPSSNPSSLSPPSSMGVAKSWPAATTLDVKEDLERDVGGRGELPRTFARGGDWGGARPRPRAEAVAGASSPELALAAAEAGAEIPTPAHSGGGRGRRSSLAPALRSRWQPWREGEKQPWRKEEEQPWLAAREQSV
jgi:hypothetical protein